MHDIALDINTHDIDFTGNKLVLHDRAYRIRQSIKIALLMIRSEWCQNYMFGVPYLDFKKRNQHYMRDSIKKTIEKVDGVKAVTELRLYLHRRDRRLSVSFAADTIYGKITNAEDIGYYG